MPRQRLAGARGGFASVFAWLLLLCAASAQAELRALLVGVSGYPGLPERYQLEGPRHDVQRMRDVLLARGFAAQRIEVLADGLASAKEPTRAAILDALSRLAREAQAGDIVVLHFAGHGSQQPADPSTPEGRAETSGLHETFLPLDVGAWDGRASTVKNAIVNHELRAAVDRIGERGAFVWGIFDACHSAALVRGGAGKEVRWRHVDPRDLGVPVAARSAARSAPSPAGAPGAGSARAVFFYAAQTTELTPELALPVGGRPQRVHGLFSWTVARALERAQAMNYRQLAQLVLAEYGAVAEAHATPAFSGNGLDTLVLGQAVAPVRQWPLETAGGRTTIAAGSLAGIDEGALFAWLPDPAAPLEKALGRLEARQVQPDRSELAAPAGGAPPPPRTAQVARLISSPSVFRLRVALDRRGCGADCTLAQAVALLRQRGVRAVEVDWTDAAPAADLVLQVQGGRALFLLPTQLSDPPAQRLEAPGVSLREGGRPLTAAALADQVESGLHTVARARNLLRVAARLAEQGPATPLKATLQWRNGKNGPLQPFAPETVPALKDGDRLVLTVDNTGMTALDLTVLYVDADHGVQALFPGAAGEINRLEPGARKLIDDIDLHAPPAGIERLLLVAVQARRGAERADFSFLQQPALVRQRGAAAEDLDVFADAAFADHRTRGASRPAAPSATTSMQVFSLKVGPR